MRTKDSELVQRIKSYIEDQCEQRGRIPPIREIAEALGVGKSSVQRYMEYMTEQGIIARGEYGYESIEQSRTEKTVSVAKLGIAPVVWSIMCCIATVTTPHLCLNSTLLWN